MKKRKYIVLIFVIFFLIILFLFLKEKNIWWQDIIKDLDNGWLVITGETENWLDSNYEEIEYLDDNNYEIESVEYDIWLGPNPQRLPLCKNIELNSSEEITDIEWELKNCSIQEWFSVYDLWWVWWMEDVVIIYQDMFTHWFQDYWKWNACFSADTEENSFPDERSQDFVNFLKKHKLNEKKLILVARENYWVEPDYYCEDKNLCESLNGDTRWENNWHYFVYWFREYESLGIIFLVIDNKVYSVWDFKFLDNSPLIKQWIWNVAGFSWDKIIFNRYYDNKYLDEYDYLYANPYDEKLEPGTPVSKFKIKTCEFDL